MRRGPQRLLKARWRLTMFWMGATSPHDCDLLDEREYKQCEFDDLDVAPGWFVKDPLGAP